MTEESLLWVLIKPIEFLKDAFTATPLASILRPLRSGSRTVRIMSSANNTPGKTDNHKGQLPGFDLANHR